MRIVRRASRLFLPASCLLLGACDPSPSIDAGTDAFASPDAVSLDAPTLADALSMPVMGSIEDGEGLHLDVLSNPLRIRLVRADGSVALESAPTAFEIGTAPGGSVRYHDVNVPNPNQVDWHALDLGIERVSATEVRVGDGLGRTARMTLTRVRAGVLQLHIEIEEGMESVALMRARFAMDDGAYQGLGERFSGADARGFVVPMQMSVTSLARESGLNEHHVPVPFVVSSKSYGLFVETREAGAFDVASTDANELRTTFEGSSLDFVFFAQRTPREVIASYTEHTGLPILPPRWSFAPMHWRNVWDDRAMLETDARALVDLHIPATSFWLDNPWTTSYVDNIVDETRFPGHIAMLQSLRASGFQPLVWNVPYLDTPDDGVADNTAEMLYREAAREGHLVRNGRGDVFQAPSTLGVSGLGEPGGMIDFTSEPARIFWQTRLDRLVRDLGIRAFKLDYGEDVVPEFGGVRPGLVFADGTSERQTHNVYAQLYHTPYRRALDEGSTEGGFVLVRASCWGGQSVADIIWPGDIDSNLTRGDTDNVGGLPAAISAMISLAASGFPNFASDTGGYREGPTSLETLMRWAEHTAFTPFLQLGGSGPHHNPWLYDATAQIPDPTGTYRELARMHTELIPFFRMQALLASRDGTPPILHPSLAFPEDLAGYADPDAYLLGQDLFVAPVVTPAATTRALHLPPGQWVHWMTGEAFTGPMDVTVDAPVGRPPVFVRVGAIIPMLAHDLETLVPAPMPMGASRISPSDRPFLRARSIPMGLTSITTEEGMVITVDHRSGLAISLAPVTAPAPDLGLRDVRMQVDLQHASPAITSIMRASVGAMNVPMSTRAAVESGCDGMCWSVEGDTLFVSARITSAQTFTFTSM